MIRNRVNLHINKENPCTLMTGAKDRQSKIAADTEEFLKGGGKVTCLDGYKDRKPTGAPKKIEVLGLKDNYYMMSESGHRIKLLTSLQFMARAGVERHTFDNDCYANKVDGIIKHANIRLVPEYSVQPYLKIKGTAEQDIKKNRKKLMDKIHRKTKVGQTWFTPHKFNYRKS